jgi:hypothetical protein
VQHPRLVLCPNGLPVHRRELCTSILLRAGGDVNRLIDAPAGESPFLAHVKRLTAMLETARSPIVFLTSLAPLLSRVVSLRERYEAELPTLRRADWLLFLDEGRHLFASEAVHHGRLERRETTALWHGPSLTRYLVVTPESVKASELQMGMIALRPGPLAHAEEAPSASKIAVARSLSRPRLVLEDFPKR